MTANLYLAQPDGPARRKSGGLHDHAYDQQVHRVRAAPSVPQGWQADRSAPLVNLVDKVPAIREHGYYGTF